MLYSNSFLIKMLKGMVLLEYPAAFLEFIQAIPKGQDKHEMQTRILEKKPTNHFPSRKA